MMKKTILTVVLIAFAAVHDCYSQSLSGEVIYKIQLISSGSKSLEFKELNDATIEIANKQTVTLNFNSTQSSFILDKYIISEAGNTGLRKMARSMAIIHTVWSDYFYDRSSNTAIERRENGQLVKKITKKLEWEITTESKMIGDYLCYKAIYLDKMVNRIGQNRSVPITAWFAPSLPYGFGPKYLNGLPGLILELEDRRVTFLASAITISNESEATIDFPKGKIIPKEEYDKKMKSQY